jgi:hypothetical protein
MYKRTVDKEDFIDPTDKLAVMDAARDLDFVVFGDEAEAREWVRENTANNGIDDEVYRTVASEASDDPFHPLTVWLEIYGWGLHRL